MMEFLPGDKVWVNGPTIDDVRYGIINGSYASLVDACYSRDFNQYSVWLFNRSGKRIVNCVSWIDKKDLSLINTKHTENWMIVDEYLKRKLLKSH